MRITSKGQVTIPREIRHKMGLLPHTEVEFTIKGNTVFIKKTPNGAKKRGEELLEKMRGRATVPMTTDQIMALTRSKQ